MSKEELAKQIRNGNHPQFVFNKEKDRVECRCGHAAVWWKTGYICGTITAYPCKFNKLSIQKKANIEVLIYESQHNSYRINAKKVSTAPEDTIQPSILKMWGCDPNEYHNIDAMGFEYDVEGDCIIVELNNRAIVSIEKEN